MKQGKGLSSWSKKVISSSVHPVNTNVSRVVRPTPRPRRAVPVQALGGEVAPLIATGAAIGGYALAQVLNRRDGVKALTHQLQSGALEWVHTRKWLPSDSPLQPDTSYQVAGMEDRTVVLKAYHPHGMIPLYVKQDHKAPDPGFFVQVDIHQLHKAL